MATVLRKLILSTLVLGSFLAGTGAVAVLKAQGQELARITARLGAAGFQSVRTPVHGSLAEGQSGWFTVYLRSDREYAIQGTCDDDCTDLDLDVTGPNGELVASDHDPDDVPHVRFVPWSSGTYRVTVQMYTCDIEPCAYAVGVYRR